MKSINISFYLKTLLFLALPFIFHSCDSLENSLIEPEEPADLATITTLKISEISDTSVSISANITADGGADVTTRGFVYNTSGAPTLEDEVKLSGSGVGNYSENISGLEANTSYHFRAYATNETGTEYSSEESVTTLFLDKISASVVSTDPEDNDQNVSLSKSILVTFSEEIDQSSITSSTFTVSANGSTVAGTISSTNTTATFTADDDFVQNTTISVTLGTGIQDTAGNSMESEYEFSFTTKSIDSTIPSLSSSVPASNATSVAINSSVSATFTEEIMSSTVTENTFYVQDEFTGSKLAGSRSISGNTITFTSSSDLQGSSSYKVVLTSGIMDLAGNALSGLNWKFETVATSTLSVSSISPASSTTNVDIEGNVVISFSELLSTSSVSSSTVRILKSGTAVSGQLTVSSDKITFNPTSLLQESRTEYTIEVNGVKDIRGNNMTSSFSSSFETELASPKYYYKIQNLFKGQSESLDTYSDTKKIFLSETSQNNSGQYWMIDDVGDANYFSLSNLFGGENLFLEAADGVDLAFLTGGLSGGGYFTGQQWRFVTRYETEGKVYWKMESKSWANRKELDHTGVMADIGNFTGRFWTLVRQGKR